MPAALQPELVFRDPAADPQAATIQPHGAVLVVDAVDSRILRAGGAVETLVRRATGELPGLELAEVFGRQALSWIADARSSRQPGWVGSWQPPDAGSPRCDVSARRCGEQMVLELEPAEATESTNEPLVVRLGRAMDALRGCTDVPGLCATVARELRELTGFERVLVVRFSDAGGVHALAEDRTARMPSLLGAWDTDAWGLGPAPTAAAEQPMGVIADVACVPLPLLPIRHTADDAQLLDGCVLGGPEATLRWRLRALGVRASLTIAFGGNGIPRGLLVAHHPDARHPGYPLRQAGMLLAQAFDRQMRAACHAPMQHAMAARHHALDGVRQALADGDDRSLEPAALQELVRADGIAIVCGERVQRWGDVPTEPRLRRLLTWLTTTHAGKVHATRRLGRAFAPCAPDDREVGLLACVSGGEHPAAVLWFRRVDRPQPSRARAATAWSQPADAMPWSSGDVDAAQQLAWVLDASSQQRSLRQLNAKLRDSLAEQQALVTQKHLLMQEVHHRAQNGLQIVNAMLQLQARKASDPAVRAQFDDAVGRLMAVSSVHRHLWQSHDMLNVRLDIYLEQLCADLVRSWDSTWGEHFSLSAVALDVPSGTAATLGLILTELLTNAVKYAYAGEAGPLRLAVDTLPDGTLQLVVRDRGRGMDPDDSSGLGSELVRVLTAQLGGTLDVSGTDGTTVTIRLP